ncbi:hypothetical protein F2Q69_00002048 [Brassica cretica]|uniref:CCHC-type domain-containing protein n=1 Tax=Brassica cretica TaxID=69181 RepID=A0A8S9NW35_BRACR|nr:hypothetical protein F2Q69_00002048 [Brassica cretica]
MASEIDAAPGSSITSPSSSPTSLTLPSMLALSSATSPALMDLTNGTSLSLSSSSLLLRTSSAPIKMTNKTTQPESVTPPLTSEAGITQVSDAPPSDSLNDVNQSNSVAPTTQLQRTSSLEFQNTSTPMVNNTSQTVLPPSNQLQISAPENDNPTTISFDIRTQASEKFVPSLGSWAKPLVFKPPATPSEPCNPHGYDPAIPPIEKLPPPELKAGGGLRFPWAARLNAQSRNFYRAATPTYRLDGTPEVSIPSKVLKLGPENKDEYIIGKFHKCSLPPGGLVHVVFNRIWGRSWVWHIDDCLLFVLPWVPEGSFKIPEVSTLPVWANLKNIPDCCYSRLGISHVASGLGEPILTHKPRLDPTSMGEAKVLVEMELDRDFPKLIALDDKQGNIFFVNVEYTWIPSMCERCGNLGHKAKRCLLPSPTVQVPEDNHSAGEPSSPAQTSIKEIEGLHSTLEIIHASPPTSVPSDTTVDHLAAGNTLIASAPSSLPIQQKNLAATLGPVNTLSTLVDQQSTPITTLIMESSPSSIINTEARKTLVVDPITTSSNACAFESPSRFTLLGDVVEVVTEPSSSLSLTRGGREIKLPTKYQDMD